MEPARRLLRTRLSLPIAVALLLAMATLALHARACAHGFVSLDDGIYVTENPHVLDGLSLSGTWWALTTTEASNWHPLTWLSLQLDCQLFGPSAWGFHLTNVVLHALNTVLLFGLWYRLTWAVWPSAVVAALFAFHPLHVESVAWISERKDVLSACFWILSLWAYHNQVIDPRPRRYALLLLVYVLGLMAKPMLVTLPCVLLLLDYWPLRRLALPGRWMPASTAEEVQPFRRLLVEKLPLVALAAASCAITVVAQRKTIASFTTLPWSARLLNALTAYVLYLGKMFWPVNLAAFYPHPGNAPPMTPALAALALLAVITFVALRGLRQRPYLIVGWLWYLGTLVPVIGLVQVGDQALADRYTYVPLIGLFVMAAWSLEALVTKGVLGWRMLAAPAVIGMAACAILTWQQIGYWHDSLSLWQHANRVTRDNHVAEASLAYIFEQQGLLDEAADHATRALRLRPNAEVHVILGNVLLRQQRPDEARLHLQEAVGLNPNLAEAYNSLGIAAALEGKLSEAASFHAEAVARKPDYAIAWMNWGVILIRQGKFAEALRPLTQARECSPQDPEVYSNLGDAWYYQERLKEALANYTRAVELAPQEPHYRCNLASVLQDASQPEAAQAQYAEALRLDPGWPLEAGRRAWRLATDPDPGLRQAAEALRLARQAVAATVPPRPDYLDALAAAYAEAGRFRQAAATARQALTLAENAGQHQWASQIQDRLALYERQLPFHRGS